MGDMAAKPMSDSEVEQAAVRILEIMAHRHRLLKIGDHSVRFADHPLLVEERRIQSSLATEFGRRYDWKRAKRAFTVEVLAGRLHHSGLDYRRQTFLGQHHDLFDHAYCYREGVRPYRAAAVAAHLYNSSVRNPGGLPSMAGRLGLMVSWPDFPSWWYPGRTHLVLVTPIKSSSILAA